MIVTQDDGRISEVRGVAEQENLDPYIGDVVNQKLAELPDGKKYEKRSMDMKFLTAIDNKVKDGEDLSRDELIFLYEIDSPIEGFGYQRDPRIEELRSQRDPKADAPVVLECQPEEIAWSADSISENTKSYIGPLFPGIFQKLANLENIYTSFPEGKISRWHLEIGGKGKEDLIQELQEKNIDIYNAEDIFNSSDFTTLPNPEQIDLVRLRVQDLGFPDVASTGQIYTRAQEVKLELCPIEVGLHQRLKDLDQPMDERYWIAMKQISGRYGRPVVFILGHKIYGLFLSSGSYSKPGGVWGSGDRFVFRLRPSTRAELGAGQASSSES